MQVFVRVAESGSFTRTAEAMDLPKASVSQYVARLEAHLGVRLLHRTTRRLRLTDDGAAYCERARLLLDDLADLESGLARAHRAPRGRLRIDVPAAFGRHVLVPALPDFQARYPELSLDIGSSDRPVDLLQDGVDCVIRGGSLHDDSLIGRRLRRYPVVTCAAPAYLCQHGLPKHPQELGRHALLGFFSAKTGQTFPYDFSQDGERIEVAGPWRHSFNDADSFLAAGLAGLGILQCVRSEWVERQLQTGALLPLLEDWAVEPLDLHILYPSRRHLSARLRVFVDWVVERLAPSD